MLSFKSYLPDDKDFGYSANDEDHCTSLFEQYLNQDPINFGDAVNNSDGVQAFDFAIDEETESSESCSADSKYTSSLSSQHQPSASFSSAPLQEPVPVRLRPKFVTADAPCRSISSSELLNLEGRADHQEHFTKPPSTSILASAAPTLRRKGKFCAPSTGHLHGRSHRIAKTPSAEMIRPSYHHESSSYNEWTQRFEQISIETPPGHAQQSPSRSTGTFRDKRPSKITTTFNQGHQQQQQQATQDHGFTDNNGSQSQGSGPQNANFGHAATAPLPQEWQNHGLPGPSPLSSADYSYGSRPPLERAQTQYHLRQPSSWDYGPVSPLTPDFVSPNHIQPQWLHSLHSNAQSYHENGEALQPAPSIGMNEPAQDFTNQDLAGFQYSPYAQFVNEDPSSDYAVLSPDRFFAPSAEALITPLPPQKNQDSSSSSINNNNNNHNNPQTPPPLRSNSDTTPLPTPTKYHRSKSTTTPHPSRRQKSLSTLKSPRSHSTLSKPAHHSRSTSSLKPPSPMKPLKSPRSSSSVSSGSGSGFGFVNFTEADKSRILTGVAPSGSSKTKARREMEAMEKKRRVSAAALRAVREAGGDVEGLRRVVELEGEEGVGGG